MKLGLKPKIAVIIPCLNEQITVGKVVKSLAEKLDNATIYVVDNASTDATAQKARDAGAVVLTQKIPGKANAVRHAFSIVDADVYLMIDGDGTYDASAAPAMINKLINEQLDMVISARVNASDEAYRFGHKIGNKFFNLLFKLIFENKFTDIFSGYRVFSKAFVKSFPALSNNFEIELELSVHAVLLKLQTAEVSSEYGARPIGSRSKLNTAKDGLSIMLKIIQLMRYNKPIAFFGILVVFCMIAAFTLGTPVLVDFYRTGLVPRVPSLIVASGFFIVGVVIFITSLILDAMQRFQAENRMFAYLSAADAFGKGDLKRKEFIVDVREH